MSNFFSYDVFSDEISSIDFEEKKMIIHTINPHSYCIAKKDNIFFDALSDSNILLPDGYGIVLAQRILYRNKISRITGADIHEYILNKGQENSSRVFYLGASPKTLKKIESLIRKKYDAIKVMSYSPPYKLNFSEEENQRIINRINKFNPDVLFVGMTAPKQEKWVYENKMYLNSKIICTIGAVFDFYSNTVKRPGKFWQKIGLEWLVRLAHEPKRLWRRTFISLPIFIWDILVTKINIKLNEQKGFRIWLF